MRISLFIILTLAGCAGGPVDAGETDDVRPRQNLTGVFSSEPSPMFFDDVVYQLYDSGDPSSWRHRNEFSMTLAWEASVMQVGDQIDMDLTRIMQGNNKLTAYEPSGSILAIRSGKPEFRTSQRFSGSYMATGGTALLWNEDDDDLGILALVSSTGITLKSDFPLEMAFPLQLEYRYDLSVTPPRGSTLLDHESQNPYIIDFSF